MTGVGGSAKTHQATLSNSTLTADLAVPAQDAAANVDVVDVVGNKTDTVGGTSLVSLIKSIGGGGDAHLPLFTGSIWYVDAGMPDDTGSGSSPDEAKETIAAGLALMGAGDALTIKAGTYDEAGLDLNVAAGEIWAEAGVFIVDSTPGTCLVVSAAGCRVRGAHFVQAGGVGLQLTGIGTIVQDCISVNCTIGFDIDEHSTQMFNCVSAGHTVTGFDVGERNTVLKGCYSAGLGASTRGFYLSAAADTRCMLNDCHSIANGTAGFEIVSSADYNKIVFSTSGGGDGATVDSGSFNDWPGYVDQLDTEHHEDIYPISAGQGVAGDPITVSNATTDGTGGQRDDQNYWGDITRIIPPDTITTRWRSVGIYIHAVTAADVQQYEVFFTYADVVSAQNAGNDWDENEVDLTVADGSIFENGDHVWITGNDRVEGEILLVSGAPAGNVVTIARETTADGEAGLRYNYDATGVNNRMYLVKRSGSTLYDGYEGDYSAPGARYHARYTWHDAKLIFPNGGMLMRMLNASDAGASSFDVRAIYED